MSDDLPTTREILKRRREAHRAGVGVLSRTIHDALEIREQMKASGTPKDELDAYFEQVVRRSWPFTREWKYLCNQCDDTGRVLMVCRKGARCQGVSTVPGHTRICAKEPDSDYEHEYGEPCYCSLGQRFKSRPKTQVDELAQIGKVSKPTRFGR